MQFGVDLNNDLNVCDLNICKCNVVIGGQSAMVDVLSQCPSVGSYGNVNTIVDFSENN